MSKHALIFQRTSGEQIIVAPSGSDTVIRRREPGNRKPWLPLRDDSGEPITNGPVAVAVTDADLRDLGSEGWSKSLAQKLIRALDKDGARRVAPNTTVNRLETIVLHQDRDLQDWVTDKRKTRNKTAIETTSTESNEENNMTETTTETIIQPEAETVTIDVTDDTRSGDMASGSTHLLVPDQKLWDTYVPREIAGVKDMDLLEFALEDNDNVLLYGPTQSGKTTAPLAFAAKNRMNCYSISGNVALEPSQLFGKFIPNGLGDFIWVDGPVTTLWRNGGVLILDEANTISPKIMTVLYPGLDARREITLLDHKGEVIKAHKDLLVVATCNPGYQGTLPMSEAFQDRFAHRHAWDYDPAVEAKLLKSTTLQKLAKEIRTTGDLRSPLSTSLLKNFERMATHTKLGWDYAVANLINRYLDSSDRESVRVLLERESDKIKRELGLTARTEAEKVEDEESDNNDDKQMTWADALSVWA